MNQKSKYFIQFKPINIILYFFLKSVFITRAAISKHFPLKYLLNNIQTFDVGLAEMTEEI